MVKKEEKRLARQELAQKKAARRKVMDCFFRGNRLRFGLIMFSTLMGAALNIAISWLLQQIIDLIGGTAQFTLEQLLIIVAGGLLLSFVCYFIDYHSSPRFYSRAMKQYREYAYSHITKKNISAFGQESASTYISALTNDAASIEEKLLRQLPTLVMNILLFIGALAMMLWYSPILTLIALLLTLLPVIASIITGGALARSAKALSDKNESLLRTLTECLSGFSVIKSFRAESSILGVFTKKNNDAAKASEKNRKIESLVDSIGGAAGTITQFGVFLAAAWLAVRYGSVSAGVVIAFVQLMNYVIGPIAQIPTILAGFGSSMALIDKLNDCISSNLRDEGQDIEKKLDRGIELRDVCFSYDEGEPVLHDLNLTFESGRSYAIVGASGSGKSTLLSLLMAAHSGYEGKIFYDDTELREISSRSLYDIVSMIQQNVFVFDSSIRDNITMFGRFEDADVDRAARLSGLAALIEERGADYLCGENGSQLSGGEKQRISIARTLLRGSPVLLADEATASLDAETAHTVTSAILDLDGLTRIVVTHALDEALLRRYDCILTLRNGTIGEMGSFEELMDKKGYFYSLFTISQ